jgi:hypothetical protein
MVKANLKGKVIAEADRTEIAEQPLFSFQIAARGSSSSRATQFALKAQSSFLHTPHRWEGGRRRRLVLSQFKVGSAENRRLCCLLEGVRIET